MNRISKDILSDLVYDKVALMLLNKDLKPGERILKKELATILGVSQTPLNEALNRLVREGILEQRERREIYVKLFTNNDMIELFEVRAGLEGAALRICMERSDKKQMNTLLSLFDEFPESIEEKQFRRYQKKDQEFHALILKMSNNKLILEFIERCEFIIRCYHKGLIRSPKETLGEHQEIVKAIKNNKIEVAQKLLMEHHWKTRERLKNI